MNPPRQVVYRATYLLLITFSVFLLGSLVSTSFSTGLMMVDMVRDPAVREAIASLAESAITEEQYTQALSDFMSRYQQTHAGWLTLLSLFSTLGTVMMLTLFVYVAEKSSMASLGLVGKRRGLHYAGGCLLGLAMFGSAMGILALSGAVEIRVSPSVSWLHTGLFFLAFVIQGASEELLLRGFLMNRLRIGRPVWVAVLISSLTFAVLHLPNEGAGGLALLNVFLFGLLASLLYLVTGSLWVSMGAHSLWNFAQGNLFGCPVSGYTVGISPLITLPAEGRELTHGGIFGPEGGLAVTLVLLTSLALVVLLGFRSPKAQKKPQ